MRSFHAMASALVALTFVASCGSSDDSSTQPASESERSNAGAIPPRPDRASDPDAEDPDGTEHARSDVVATISQHAPAPEKLAVELKPDPGFGEAVQQLLLTTPDGTEIPGLVATPPVGPDSIRGCVLVQHGLSANARATWPIAALVLSAGYRVVAIDARGHGERSVRGTEVTDSPQHLAALSRGTISDIQWTLDWLGTQPGCNPDHLGYVGISWGGITGAMMLSVEPRISAPIFLVAGADFRTIFSTSSVGAFQEWAASDLDAAVDAFSDIEPADGVSKSLTDTPILMINGKRDTVITSTAAEMLHKAVGTRGTTVWYDGGHGVEDLVQALLLVNSFGSWADQHGDLLRPPTEPFTE